MPTQPKTYDGAAEFSRITGRSREEILSIWEEVKANKARLDACPRHRFTPVPVRLGDRFTCTACGGVVNLADLGNYVKGYRAAGGDPNDIWPGWDRRHAQKETA